MCCQVDERQPWVLFCVANWFCIVLFLGLQQSPVTWWAASYSVVFASSQYGAMAFWEVVWRLVATVMDHSVEWSLVCDSKVWLWTPLFPGRGEVAWQLPTGSATVLHEIGQSVLQAKTIASTTVWATKCCDMIAYQDCSYNRYVTTFWNAVGAANFLLVEVNSFEVTKVARSSLLLQMVWKLG